METLELPLLEETTDETPAGTCAEEEIDLAAFELWRQASCPEIENKGE
jgi:hypothetical protein